MSNSTQPQAGDATTEERLVRDLEHAQASLAAIEQEYDDLLHDSGAIQEDRDTTRRLLEEARSLARNAALSLERFRGGGYGTCAKCGGPIAPERLEALPDTTFCTPCAS